MPIYPRQTKTKGLVHDVAVHVNGKLVWRRGFKTRELARAEEVRLLYDAQRGVDPAPGRLTVARFLREYYLVAAKVRVSAGTYVNYERAVRDIVPLIGNIRLARLRPADIQVVLADLKRRGFKASTAQGRFGILIQALHQAVRWELLGRNPGVAVNRPPMKRRRPPLPRWKELARLFEEADKEGFGVLVRLAVATGMRRSELLALTWAAVDLEDGTIVVKQAKTDAGLRAIAIGRDMVAALREHRQHALERRLRVGSQWRGSETVFTSSWGESVKFTTWHQHWRRIVRRAGLPDDLHFHDLRHYHGSLLARAGVHVRVAQERLGHADSQTTLNIYTHTLGDEQREAAEAVERLLRDAL